MRNSVSKKLFRKYLHHKTTPEEQQQLLTWLQEEDETDRWLNFEWNYASNEMNSSLRHKIFRTITNQITLSNQRPKTQKLIWITSIAASIILLLSIGIVQFFSDNEIHYAETEIITDPGQKVKINLPDGTHVSLNSATSICYSTDYNNKERHVFINGEAYFEVAKDKSCPFIVSANGMDVRALGTAFNVKSFENDLTISTTLVTGKVAVTYKKQQIILYPNQRAIVNKKKGHLSIVSKIDSDKYIQWRNNYILFDGKSLEKIAHELERNYNVDIEFKSEKIKQERFYGQLYNSSLNSILETMLLASPIEYHRKNNKIIFNEKH